MDLWMLVLTALAALLAGVGAYFAARSFWHQTRYEPRWGIEPTQAAFSFLLVNGSDERADDVRLIPSGAWAILPTGDFGTMYPGDRRWFTVGWHAGDGEPLVTIEWQRPKETETRAFVRRLPDQ